MAPWWAEHRCSSEQTRDWNAHSFRAYLVFQVGSLQVKGGHLHATQNHLQQLTAAVVQAYSCKAGGEMGVKGQGTATAAIEE